MPNLFATGALAKRIEAAEASLVADVGTSVGRRRGESSVYIQAISGGMAVFSGPDSPVNKVAGLGFEPLDDAILAEVEEAFAARKTPVRVEVSTLADPAVGVLLTGRGYELRGFENVLALALDPTTVPGSIGEIAITDAAPGTSQWVDVVVTGFTYPDEFDGPPPTESFGAESLTEIMNDMSEIPGFHRYLGWRNGVVAGGGGLRIFDRVAQLSGASTLPDHRRHGVQTALLQHRLGQAAAAGCDIAVVTTEPGSKSQQNVQRQGFSLLYARAVLVKG
jgi:GNAT superfamily N-acetyltransferase